MSFFNSRTKGKIKKPLFMILYSGPGVGKCFDPETKVLMHNGKIKRIRDISVGDKVMGPDSKPRKVVGRSFGIDDMYKVTLKKGDSFTCNSRHDIYGQTKKFKDFKIEAKELNRLSSRQIERYKILRTGVKFKSSKTLLDPYFLGLWLGDGTKDLNSLCISNPDKEVHGYLKKFCKDNDILFKKCDGLNLRLPSFNIGESFRKHPVKWKLEECVVNGEKRIPQNYLINSRVKRLRLLAGLLDTDGYLIHKTFEIVTQYEGLGKDIIFLAKSLGFQATLRNKFVDGKCYKRIIISGETSNIPTKIKRKKAEKRIQVKSVLREGFSISKLPKKGEYVGISVDGDNLFLLDNFVIVHNTSAAASFPGAHFFDFEESTHNIDVNRSRPVSYAKLLDDLDDILAREPGDLDGVKTLVFDTIDELERLMHNHIASVKDKSYVGDIGFQKGYELAVNYWADFISMCRLIRDKHNVHFVFLAHSVGRSQDDVELGESYQRHAIGIHKKAASYLFGAVEMVLFAKKDVILRVDGDRVIAKDCERRVLCTSLNAHYDAKNRIGLPNTLPMPHDDAFQILWGAYEKAFDQTPATVLKECLDELSKLDDEKKRAEVKEYIERNNDDISILRASLERIKSMTGGKNA